VSKHRQLSYGSPIPQDFLDALQEFVGVSSRNLFLTQIGSNQVQIAAGVGNAQVSLGIDGLWRYVSATVQTTVTGAAGTYSIFATTGNNSFATNPTPPPPETDSTDYTFALTALLTGTPATPHYRKIGEAIFDGTRITNLRQLVDGGVDGAQLWQPGDIKLTACQTPPAGWLVCDGSTVSRTTFPALYAALGGTTSPWGQGDGSTTFALPDFRGRAPIGAGQGAGLTSRVLASKGGEETHLLANAEMPVHAHGASTGNDTPDHSHYSSGTTSYVSSDHSHAVSGTTGTDSPDHAHNLALSPSNSPVTQSGGQGCATIGGGSGTSGATARHAHSFSAQTGGISANHTHTWSAQSGGANTRHTHPINNDGGGAAHNVMQPWVAATYLIKT
jgi:microcystin-dependent protein